MAERRETLHDIQHLRAIAVLLVVLAHIHQGDARFLAPSLLGDFAYTGFAGVDVFFVVSGFIIHHLYRNQSGLDLRFVLNRVNRIYPLYWIFTAAALAGYALLGDSLSAGLGELDILASLSLVPQDRPPILQVGWTLTHELYFYGCYGLWLALPARLRPAAALLWGAATLAAMPFEAVLTRPWFALLASPFNLQFLAGALLAEFGSLRSQAWPSRLAPVLAAAGLAGAAMWTQAGGGLDALADPRARVIAYTPFAVGLVWSFRLWQPALPRLLERAGNASYAIYLSHILVIGVLARLAAGLGSGNIWISLAFYIVAFASCLLVGWISHVAMERPLLRAGKRGIGALLGPRRRRL
jgi:peptidoglycan/LPS O-acetylase OafA/YrhL